MRYALGAKHATLQRLAMPSNGIRYSRDDSRAEVDIFIHIKRKPDIQLVEWHIYFIMRNVPN